jgi:RHS repeat-associated protein
LTSEKSKNYLRRNYLFGFNGKETDTETDLQDYGMRIYNPSLGKFLSVDPLTQSYPWYTPYQFAGNKPIVAIDLDGLEEYIVTNIYDVNGKLTSSTIDFRTDANGIINQNYTSADKVNHSCSQVMVNNRYKQADGTYRNEYSYQDALTKEQYDATQNATATDLVQYITLGGDKYKNVKAWQANIPLPPPPPAPKYKPGQIITLDNAQTYTLVSTTGVTGGSSLNDINKPAYDGELSPDGRKYYQKLGRDIGKNPGAVTQINVTLHYEVGNNYTGTWPPAGITLGGPTAAKEVNQYIRKGLEGVNVKINVTFDYKTVNNGGYGATPAGATIQIQ